MFTVAFDDGVDELLGRAAAGLELTLLPRALAERAWCEGRVALHALLPYHGRVRTLFARPQDKFLSVDTVATITGK